MTPVRASLTLLGIAIALQGLLFQHLHQGVYYFGLLTLIMMLAPKFRLPILCISALWLLMWMDSIGTFYDLYGRFNWYDDMSHIIVSAAATLGIVEVVGAYNPNQSRKSIVFTGCMTAIALMAGYEVLEYWIEQTTNFQFIWGKFDTTLDIQSDIIGALGGSALALWTRRTSTKYASQ